MMNDYDVEKFLSNIPRPHVVGHHRSQLKSRLLNSPRNERKNMNTRQWKWAIAACCSLLLLTAVGWAAQEIIRKAFLVQVEEQIALPDGSVENVVTHESIVTFDQEDATQEKAEQVDRDVRQNLTNLWLDVAKGNYKLVEVKELDSGNRCYIYHFTMEDGSISEYSSNVPLPEPQTDSQTELQLEPDSD